MLIEAHRLAQKRQGDMSKLAEQQVLIEKETLDSMVEPIEGMVKPIGGAIEPISGMVEPIKEEVKQVETK